MNNEDTKAALTLAKMAIELMIEEERCGDTFVASVLSLDKINHVLNNLENIEGENV